MLLVIDDHKINKGMLRFSLNRTCSGLDSIPRVVALSVLVLQLQDCEAPAGLHWTVLFVRMRLCRAERHFRTNEKHIT